MKRRIHTASVLAALSLTCGAWSCGSRCSDLVEMSDRCGDEAATAVERETWLVLCRLAGGSKKLEREIACAAQHEDCAGFRRCVVGE